MQGPPPTRSFVAVDGKTVVLGLEGSRTLEARGGRRTARDHGSAPRAFVALVNRARRLSADGFAEDAPPGEPATVPLRTLAEQLDYLSVIDPTRSLPRQEHLIVSAVAKASGDAHAAELLATFLLILWPSVFDVAEAIETHDEPGPALLAVLERELRLEKRRYPRELIRLAAKHGSARTLTLALAALERTRDPDAWLDVLIEGEPFLDRSHLPALTALARTAPNRDVAKMARDIARELRPARRRR